MTHSCPWLRHGEETLRTQRSWRSHAYLFLAGWRKSERNADAVSLCLLLTGVARGPRLPVANRNGPGDANTETAAMGNVAPPSGSMVVLALSACPAPSFAAGLFVDFTYGGDVMTGSLF